MLAQVNHETVVVGTPLELLDEDDATSTVTHRDLERRLRRSAPDALRYEPGVFVQQTAHAQGSAYLRGLTGQQTVLLFDGIRLNNATYQQSDAPRTDQCPAPTAPADECLTYEAQHRHLAYAAWDGALGTLAERARVTLSWQRQHEQRRLDLTSTNRVDRGEAPGPPAASPSPPPSR